MNIFQEVTESRMLRHLGRISGKRVSELARDFYEHMLALQILALEAPNLARTYANRTMQTDFDGFRSTSTDLFNIVVLLMHQDRYSEHLKQDINYTVHDLRLKRALRAVASGRIDNQDYSQLMFTLFFATPGLNDRQANLRRIASEWSSLNPMERQRWLGILVQEMRTYRIDPDLFQAISRLT